MPRADPRSEEASLLAFTEVAIVFLAGSTQLVMTSEAPIVGVCTLPAKQSFLLCLCLRGISSQTRDQVVRSANDCPARGTLLILSGSRARTIGLCPQRVAPNGGNETKANNKDR